MPQLLLGVGNREPVPVVRQLQQDRIVQQHTVMVAQRNILALPHHALAQVTRAEDLRQLAGIRTFEFHLALNGHIPHRDAIDDPPVFFFRLAIAGRHQHVVVGRKAGHTIGHSGIEIRRRAQPGGGKNGKHGQQPSAGTKSGRLGPAPVIGHRARQVLLEND